MSQTYDYDLFVIGAGSGGVRLARMSAALGAKVAVAEDKYLGGTCVNVGCVPKKLFVYASHVAEDLKEAQGFGWSHEGALSFNWHTLLENKNIEIQRLNGIYQNLLVNSGATIIKGRARFVDNHSVKVGDKVYTAERIVIATGSKPYIPEFPGKEFAISSNELFHLEYLPHQAIVVGGGYIAVEMAGILNGLGVETTLVYRGDLFLRGFDHHVREFVKAEMLKKGIALKFNSDIHSIQQIQEPIRDLVYQVNFESGESQDTGMVLYATGRVPFTDDLGLENINLNPGKNGHIIVDDHFQTEVPSVYAIGDVIGGMQLTPVALAEGMFLANYFYAEKKPLAMDYSCIPTAVFCQPNIGTVGLTEEEAKAQVGEITVFESDFRPMKHTLSGSNERCYMKMIVAKQTDKVLGIHMVGAEAGEIIQGMAVALKAGATKQVFDSTLGIHPTAAEEFVTMRQARAN